MFKIAILDDWNHSAKDSANWSELGAEVEVTISHEYFTDDAALIKALGDKHCVVIMRERTKFHKDIFAALPKLKLLVTSGPKNSAIDLKAAEEHNVIVSGTKSLKQPPAELTLALMLNLARHITQENTAFRQAGPWNSTLGVGLYGKTLGILGLGKIGQLVAKVAKAMGMNVMAWSQNLTKATADEHDVQLAASKEELLRRSDVVSIHLRLGERSRGLMDAAAFDLMKPTSMLINTSRAEIVDQEAMINALQQGKIAAAASDVFTVEPLSSNHPLRGLANFLGTPHIGYVTDTNYAEYFPGAVRAISAYLRGEPIMELYPSKQVLEQDNRLKI